MNVDDFARMTEVELEHLRATAPELADVATRLLPQLDGVHCTLHYLRLGELEPGKTMTVQWRPQRCLLTEVCFENTLGYHVEARVRRSEIPTGFPTELLVELEAGDEFDLIVANDSAEAPMGLVSFLGFHLRVDT